MKGRGGKYHSIGTSSNFELLQTGQGMGGSSPLNTEVQTKHFHFFFT